MLEWDEGNRMRIIMMAPDIAVVGAGAEAGVRV